MMSIVPDTVGTAAAERASMMGTASALVAEHNTWVPVLRTRMAAARTAPRSHTSLDRRNAGRMQARDIVASTWRAHSRTIVEERMNTAARAEEQTHPPIETMPVVAEIVVHMQSTVQRQRNSTEQTTKTW